MESKLDQIKQLRERQVEQAATRPCALYRCFDTSGGLLYVGQSLIPGERILSEHCKRHLGALATITVQWFGSVEKALEAERAAIAGENPTHNRSPGIRKSGLPSFKTDQGKFDRKAYQRELMRKRRAAEKEQGK